MCMKQTVEEAAKTFSNHLTVNDTVKALVELTFKTGAEWQAKQSPWTLCKDKLPKIKGGKAKSFIIVLKVKVNDKIYYPTTIAMKQNHESQDGIAYTPKNKFFWGADIFEEVIAWMPIPTFKKMCYNE